MASVPTLADLLSIGTEVDLGGKKVTLRPPNLLEQGKYQRWLEEQARQSVNRATYLSDDAVRQAQNDITRDIASGIYQWGGQVCVAALQQPDGVAKLVEIVCSLEQAEARKLVDDYLGQIVALIRAASDDDPKAIAQALKSLGLPPDFLGAKTKPASSKCSGARRSTKRKRKSKR
jgi:hypothetical protein